MGSDGACDGACDGGVAAVSAAVGPWVSEETNINFAALPRDAAHYASAWTPDSFGRLATVRATYDADGLFPYGVVA